MFCHPWCFSVRLNQDLPPKAPLELPWTALVTCFLWTASGHEPHQACISLLLQAGECQDKNFRFFSRFWRREVHFREHQTLLAFIPTWLNAPYCCQHYFSSSIFLFLCWLLAATSLHSCSLSLIAFLKDPCQEPGVSLSYVTLFFHCQFHLLFCFWLFVFFWLIYLSIVICSLWIPVPSSVLIQTVTVLSSFQGLLYLPSSLSCRILVCMLFLFPHPCEFMTFISL